VSLDCSRYKLLQLYRAESMDLSFPNHDAVIDDSEPEREQARQKRKRKRHSVTSSKHAHPASSPKYSDHCVSPIPSPLQQSANCKCILELCGLFFHSLIARMCDEVHISLSDTSKEKQQLTSSGQVFVDSVRAANNVVSLDGP